MKMDAGIDTGPMFSIPAGEINPETDDALTLAAKTGRNWRRSSSWNLTGHSGWYGTVDTTTEDGATYASMLKKEDGLLGFQPARAENCSTGCSAFYPWPGTYLLWEDQPMKIIKARA